VQNLNLSYNDLTSTAIDQEGTMRACKVAEEKKRKRTTPDPPEVVPAVRHQSTIWFTHHPRDCLADLRSSGETTSSFSRSNSSTTPVLRSLHSTKGS
jgi:hypothetical protein